MPGSLLELTENRGCFVTKVFISIQFINCSAQVPAFAHGRESVARPLGWWFPMAKAFRPGQRSGGGKELGEKHTPSPQCSKGACLHVSVRVTHWRAGISQ